MEKYLSFFCILLPPLCCSSPLDISRAVETALQNDRTLALFNRKNRLNKLKSAELARSLLPVLSFSGNLSRISFENDYRQHTVEAVLKQPVWDGGRFRLQRKILRLDMILENFNIISYRAALIRRTRENFFNLLRIEESIKIQKEYEAAAGQQLQIAEKEKSLGMLIEIDYLEILQNVKQAGLELYMLENEYTSALADFKILLDIDDEISCDGNLHESFIIFLPRLSSEETADMIPRRSSAVLKTRAALSRAGAELDSVKNFFPEIALDSFYRLLGPFSPQKTRDYGLGISLSWGLAGSSVNSSGNISSEENSSVLRSEVQSGAGILDQPQYFRNLREKQLAVLEAENEARAAEKQTVIMVKSMYKRCTALYRQIKYEKEQLSVIAEKIRLRELQVSLGEEKRLQLMDDLIEQNKKKLAHALSVMSYLKLAGEIEESAGLSPDELGCVQIIKTR